MALNLHPFNLHYNSIINLQLHLLFLLINLHLGFVHNLECSTDILDASYGKQYYTSCFLLMKSWNLTLTLGVLSIFYLIEFCWNLLRVYRIIRVPEGTSYFNASQGNSIWVPVFFNRVMFSRYLTLTDWNPSVFIIPANWILLIRNCLVYIQNIGVLECLPLFYGK
jgi:hypothetical protein